MKKPILQSAFAIFFILLTSSIFSQSTQTLVNVAWKDTSGHPNVNLPYVVGRQDNAGNYYIVGNTYSLGYGTELHAGKYSSTGTPLWAFDYNNGDTSYAAFGVDLYLEGSYVYIAGTLWDSVDHTAYMLTVKMDATTGSVVWEQPYAGSYGGLDIAASIKVDDSSNVYVAGTEQTSPSDFRMQIIKYNSSGSLLWSGHYDSAGLYDGAVGMSIVHGAGPTAAVLTGFSGTALSHWDFATPHFNIGTGALVSVSRSSNGNGNFSTPAGVDKDYADNTYIAGTATVAGINTDIKIIKYDTLFAQVWEREWGNADSLPDNATRMAMDVANNILVTGYTTAANGATQMLTLKYNSSGTLQWSRTVAAPNPNDSAAGQAIVADVNQNVYVTGKIYNGSDYDYLTVAYDASGNLLWQRTYDRGSNSNDQAIDVTTDNAGGVYVSGTSTNATTRYVTIKYNQTTAFIPNDTINPNNAFAYYENRGQIHSSDTLSADSMFYYTNAGNPQIYIGDKRLSYVIGYSNAAGTTDTMERIDMNLLGTGASTYNKENIYADAKANGFLNYFLGYLPAPITRVEGYERLVQKDVYKGVDWELCSTDAGITSYFIINPTEDPSQISFKYKGADSVRFKSNILKLYAGGRCIQMDTLRAFQYDSLNHKVNVSISYDSTGANKFSFTIGGYDGSKALIVEQRVKSNRSTNDLQNITWSTYYGGDSHEDAFDIKTDNNNVYITGGTLSDNFPVSPGLAFSIGQEQSYLVKFNSTGVRKWSTLFGGGYISWGKAIAIRHSTNEPFVCGTTKDDGFPVKDVPPAYQASGTIVGAFNAPISYIARFNPDDNSGGGITWASYFTGTQNAICFSDNNDLYMVGTGAGTSDYPYKSSLAGGGFNNTTASTSGVGCITRFDPSLQISWATGFGSLTSIATDLNATALTGVTPGPDGSIYVVGSSESTANNFSLVYSCGSDCEYNQSYNSGSTDGIVMQISSIDNVLWSTYFGGSGEDRLTAVASYLSDVNNQHIYISGWTSSTTLFPAKDKTTGSVNYKSTCCTSTPDISDGVFIDLITSSDDATKNRRSYVTYYGGDNEDRLNDVCSSSNGVAYCTGYTFSDNLSPITPTDYYSKATNALGGKDVLVVTFSNDVLVWSTYLGGDVKDDEGMGIDINGLNNLYITGNTYSWQDANNPSNAYPIQDPGSGAYYQPDLDLIPPPPLFGGFSNDAFVTEFNVSTLTTKINVIPSNNLLSIYPNPSTDEIFIQWDGINTSNFELTISNSIGQKIFENKGLIKKIDVSKLPQGLYLLKLNCDGKDEVAKFVKL